jgi:hypothetical protein
VSRVHALLGKVCAQTDRPEQAFAVSAQRRREGLTRAAVALEQGNGEPQ